MTTYVLVIAAACLAVLGVAFARTDVAQRLVGAVLALLIVFSIVATIFVDPVTGLQHDILVLFALVLAVAGGGIVTTAAFETIDASRSSDTHGRTVTAAAEVLRGGAWVGALERLAIFGSLAALWPEGVAVVLAVKGLGRYPELKGEGRSGAAERFIIGTMISVIWAVACVYVAFAPYVVPAR